MDLHQWKVMNRKLIFIICLVFISAVFCEKSNLLSSEDIKNLKPKAKKKLLGKSFVIKQEPYNPEEIYQLKALYEFGNQSALDVLIKIYQDKNQLYDIRILCLDILSTIDNPLVKDAIQTMVENVEFLELTYLIKSIEILQNYGDLQSTNSLVKGLKNSENKIWLGGPYCRRWH